MPHRKFVVAFAGTGPSTYENTRDLLNDFFGMGRPDKEGDFDRPEDLDLHILLPASDTHISEPLMTIFDWTDHGGIDYDLYVAMDADRKNRDVKALISYANKTSEVTNVNSALIDGLKTGESNGYEPLLLLFWGQDGDDNAEILLDLASSAGIKARDITAGLDDLSFDEPTPTPDPEPESEPEPEPEEKPRRRGRARQPLQEEVTPLEDKPEPEPEPNEPDLQEQISEGVHRAASQSDDDVMTKALALKHEAKRREVSPVIRHRCGYHKATDQTAPLHAAVRKVTEDYMHLLDGLLPEGREKEAALMVTEQTMFWANAAVARAGAQEPPVGPDSPSVGEDTGEAKRGRGRPRNDGQPTRPRTAEEKALTEIWDEDEQAWKPKGRGRIPKGAQTRLVDPKTGDVITPEA